MKVCRILIPVFCVAITFLPCTFAQQSETVIRAQVNLVNVLFSAFNKKGEHIKGLSKKDVEIYEDGTKQNVEFFAYEGGAQADLLTIALLMDTSGSVKDKLGMERTIALDFFTQVLRPKKDLAAVIEFASEVALAQDFTDDLHRLEGALQSLRGGGSTALYDAIYLASEEKLKTEVGRKVILVVSDGEDTSSKITRKEAINTTQKNDVTLFAIGVKSSEFSSDFGALKELAKETGGRFYNPKLDMPEITSAFQGILTTLKQQYNISYYSTNQKRDGTFRRIQIRVKRDKVRVQHRSGYYAPRS
ncbi:MAG: VWA domain-containing protein [Acidobacteria bacterium]|nr:VWA domain-containing protein [Acidobacteriota bacterium]